MRYRNHKLLLPVVLGISLILFCCAINTSVNAQPEPYLKWVQPPNMKDGYNVESWTTVENTPYVVVADDWLCTTGLPIVHIRWWGSYRGWMENNPEPVDPPPVRPVVFIISWHKYIPGPPYSMPGELIYEEYCTDFTEEYYGVVPRWNDPTGSLWEHEYIYDQDLHLPFLQEAGEMYFVNIQAVFVVEPPFPWGWKNSELHWNDDAVILSDEIPTWSELIWPPGHRLAGQSMDMAFELWSPQPTPTPSPTLTPIPTPTLTPTPTPTPTSTPTPTPTETPPPMIKWEQPPNMIDGFNVESWTTAEGIPYSVVADDWLCTTGLPIVHIRWWGSYLGWMEDTQEGLLTRLFFYQLPQSFVSGLDGRYPRRGSPTPCSSHCVYH